MTPTHVYSFLTPEFGRIECAGSRADVLEIRKRFRGAGPVEAQRLYKYCEQCDSKPCCCEETKK